MKTKNKRRIALLLAVVSVVTLALGSLAYFTDRINVNKEFQAAKVSDIINVTPKDDKKESDNPGEDLEKKWEATNEDLTSQGLLRPGDGYDLSYNLTNLGDTIDVRETICLTITDSLGNDLATTVDGYPGWRLFSAYSEDDYLAKTGTTAVATETITGNQLMYKLDAFVLEEGKTVPRNFYAILNKYAGNEFQGSVCKVEYLVEMRPHTESLAANEGWEPFCTAEITFGGSDTYKAVPKA